MGAADDRIAAANEPADPDMTNSADWQPCVSLLTSYKRVLVCLSLSHYCCTSALSRVERLHRLASLTYGGLAS